MIFAWETETRLVQRVKVVPQRMRLNLDGPQSAGFAIKEIIKKIKKHSNMLQTNYSLILSLNMLLMSQTLWQALRI